MADSNLTVKVVEPKGYETAPEGLQSKGFWVDNEIGDSINFKLLGFAPEGVSKTSKGILVEVQLLQPAKVNSKPEGSDKQVEIVAQAGDICWVNVRLKLDLLRRFALAGMNPDVYLRVDQKIKTGGGNDLYIYAFQHSPDAYKQLLGAEKREKAAAEMSAAASHPLS